MFATSWQMLAWLMQMLVSGDESLSVINQALFSRDALPLLEV